MSPKSKIDIFPRLSRVVALTGAWSLVLTAVVWLSLPGRLRAEGEMSGDLASFSGSHQLREAIWKLGAFIPAGEGNWGKRSLKVDDIKGLPPVIITLTFAEPLDPWPQSLELVFQAEAGRPPLLFTLRDRRPFGGPNIELAGPTPGATAQREAAWPQLLLLDLLSNLNARLLAGRPRLTSFQWVEESDGFQSGRCRLLYGARLGPADLFLLRFDPNKFSFKPYHETEYQNGRQAGINSWAERLADAVALINGGQYYPDRTYMGSLERDGRSLSSGRHRQWKGFVVSGPKEDAPAGAPAAAVLDLDESDRTWRPEHYQNVMQSFMLLDHRGVIRVRDSRNLAGRAALGEDGRGRLILIMTPAAISLYDMATALKAPALDLKRVLAFDGGFEAQMFMRRSEAGFFSGGQISISDNRAVYIPGYRPPLPAVLAVEPRPTTAEDEAGE